MNVKDNAFEVCGPDTYLPQGMQSLEEHCLTALSSYIAVVTESSFIPSSLYVLFVPVCVACFAISDSDTGF